MTLTRAARRNSSAASAVTVQRRRQPRDTRIASVFLAPAGLLLAAFLLVPFVLAIYFSMTSQRLLSPLPTRFVGFENYLRLFDDATFLQALLNTALFVVVVVPLQTGLGLWLAILVNRKLAGAAFFRFAFFAPICVVLAVAATVWKLLFEPDRGSINGVLGLFTGGALQPGWLTSTSTALASVVIMSVWQSVGVQMAILLAALQDVDPVLYEASALDGANRWQQFLNVTLPGLRNSLIFVATITSIFAWRLFDQVYVMTDGGPLGATNTVMLELVRSGYDEGRIGVGSAIAVLLFVIVVVLTLLQRAFVREEVD